MDTFIPAIRIANVTEMSLHCVDNVTSEKHRRIERRNTTTEPIHCCPHVTPAHRQKKSDMKCTAVCVNNLSSHRISAMKDSNGNWKHVCLGLTDQDALYYQCQTALLSNHKYATWNESVAVPNAPNWLAPLFTILADLCFSSTLAIIWYLGQATSVRKLDSSGYISVAESIGVSSTTFT